MVCKNGGMTYWMVCKMTEFIDHPRHDIDTETTDMRYSSIEWCAKMVEPMTDILNGQSRSDIDTHADMCKMAESIRCRYRDHRHAVYVNWLVCKNGGIYSRQRNRCHTCVKMAESIPDSWQNLFQTAESMTDMLYRSIEWYAKTMESMTDMCKNGGIDDRPIV